MSKGDSWRFANRHELYKDLRKYLSQVYAGAKKVLKCIKVRSLVEWLQTKLSGKAPIPLSHWHKLFESFQESPQRVFTLIEESLNKRNIPDIKVSRIEYPEAGALSAKRLYLRVQRREHIFDVCAAPFGTAFFVSWWLGKKQKPFWLLALIVIVLFLIVGRIIGLPWWISLGVGLIITGLWGLSLRPTYYRLDTAMMFQDSVHSAVLEAIGQVTDGKGLRGLTELEQQPILSDLFKRRFK